MMEASIEFIFFFIIIKEIKEIKLISSPIQAVSQEEAEAKNIVLNKIIKKKINLDVFLIKKKYFMNEV